MASLPGSAPSGPKPGHLRGSYRHQRGRGPKPQKSQARVRPTHFIAIPMNTNSKLRSRLSTFQSHLLSSRDTEQGGWIRGLHPSIAINPIRFHLTIAVMGLQDDAKTGPAKTEASGVTATSAPKEASDTPSVAETQSEQAKPKTVTEALELLSSLQPKMQEILYGMSSGTSSAPSAPVTNSPLRVRLDHMEIMRPVKPPPPNPQTGIKKSDSTSTTGTVPPGAGLSFVAPSASDTTSSFEGRASSREVWADVLYLSPKEDGPEGVKLRQLGDLINLTFRNAGYLTDTRPLKLHCTVLNTSHRKPSRDRKYPFCYSDILQCEEAWKALFASSSASQATLTPNASQTPTSKPSPSAGQDVHSAVKVQLGAVPHPLRGTDVHDEWMEVDVTEVGLWKMGSHAKDGSYVSCGNVKL